MPPLDRGRQKLIEKVLGEPEFFPSAFTAWVPRQVESNPTIRFSADQLPVVDKVHLVGATGEPAFQNSFTNWGGGFVGAGFWIDPWRTVHIQGLVNVGTAAISTIFTLPGGYRPKDSELFMVHANGGVGRVDVASSGAVQLIIGGGVGTHLQIGGITFRQFQ